MSIIVATLGISILCYLFGTLYGPKATDYRDERQASKASDEVSASSEFSRLAVMITHP